MIRAGLAAFGVAPDAARVIVPDTGGGWAKMAYCPRRSRWPRSRPDRPAREVVETRQENLMGHPAREGPEVECADGAGVLLALRARVLSDAGARHIYPLTQAWSRWGSEHPMGGAPPA
jgi:hypothetical protein